MEQIAEMGGMNVNHRNESSICFVSFVFRLRNPETQEIGSPKL